MCVGLSAKVVKISNGTAVIDAGGAKERFHLSCWKIWNREIMLWFTPVWQLPRSQMRMTARQISSWRNFCNGGYKQRR